MNQNHLFWYLPIGLAEDLQRLKMQGEFEQAVRLIDLRLKEENIPQHRAGDGAYPAGNTGFLPWRI